MTILLLLTGMMTIISTFSSEDSRRIAYKALSREPETSKKKKKKLTVDTNSHFVVLFIII